jgi:hypothetical protein
MSELENKQTKVMKIMCYQFGHGQNHKHRTRVEQHLTQTMDK